MNPVRLQHIRKTFLSLRRGRVTALKGIDLQIEPGEFFVLLGPSGCGKSTLLNVIAGLEKPTDGDLYIGDRLVASTEKRIFLTPRERDIAMVFQSYALYPHMTVAENIAFPLRIAKMDKREIERKVHEAAETLEIGDLLDARPGELSGGQRQRVALGRAIVREPRVLLLDEPLSNLDALLRISMRAELKRIQRELKVTTIYVTHDQTEAMSLGDTIAVLNEGEVLQVGRPDDIYNDPQNVFVARFVGTPPMNLMDGRIISRIHPHPDIPQGRSPERITVGIRPEHLTINGHGEYSVEGRVTMVGSLGSETLLYIDIDGQEVIARASGTLRLKEGESTHLTADSGNIYFFDSDSGRRLA
jgi:multiple sugar transport system ATP-binding protein